MHSSSEFQRDRAAALGGSSGGSRTGRPASESDEHFEKVKTPSTNSARGNLSGISVERDFPHRFKKRDHTVAPRDKIKKILNLYHVTLSNLLRENDKSIAKTGGMHQKAAMVLRYTHGLLNAEKRLGSVPGVEIGDEFGFRAELYIIGLHLQFQKGIDYMNRDGTTLATSIVATNRYENTLVNSDVLIYVGEGGNPLVGCSQQDQELKRGNLALKNSCDKNTPVRVIGTKKLSDTMVYVYDGLYLVEKYWRERGQFDKLVFKFQLRRISRQSRPRGFIGKSNEHKGLILDDISRGKERFPIGVVNTIDDDRPSPFTYVVNVTIPLQFMVSKTGWCDCVNGCSDSEDCSCKAKNGGVLGYGYDERVLKESSFIYECGPCCKCFKSCINRVSQRGIRLQLEVFKTESKGWGLRSKTGVGARSFICEYVGEIVTLKEAKAKQKKNKGEDYLFLLENNRNDELYAIDATKRGNVGRFINHSCSPNLYFQRVFIGHDSKLYHVMFFAMKDIPPFEELTYDYKCRFGEFEGKNLNVAAKNCCCGSLDCVGKFY